MKTAIAKVVQVMGNCNADYKLGDRVVVNLDNACIEKKESYLLMLEIL